jgi:Glutaminyl-tRNA synthetase, non-specific RNA binding region part 2
MIIIIIGTVFKDFPFYSFNQEELDRKLFEVLGEKTEADEKKPMKKKKEKPAKTEVLFHNITSEIGLFQACAASKMSLF